MSKIFVFEGQEYEVPDEATVDDFAKFMRKKQVAQTLKADEKLRAEAESSEDNALLVDPLTESESGVANTQVIARPSLGTMSAPPPKYRASTVLKAEDEAEVQKRYETQWPSKQSLYRSDAEKKAASERLYADLRKEIADKRSGVSSPGQEAKSPPESGLPFFRPTRMVQVPTSIMEAQESVVGEDGDVRTEVGSDTTKFTQLYKDPTTGIVRKPTASELLTEAAARQPVMTVADARAVADAIARGEKDAPLLRGILSERDASSGAMIETPLKAILRSVPAYMEAAVADAYFRGLGYEVDEKGQPIDKSDFGYKVAEARRYFNLPDVVRVGGPVTTQIEQMIGRPIPITVAPLPGVATRREEGRYKGIDTFDPESRLPASGPSASYAERISQAVAGGRGLGEEFASSPKVVEEAERLMPGAGQELAWASGTLMSLGIPAGPGTVLRAVSGFRKLAATGKLGKTAVKGSNLLDSGASLAGRTVQGGLRGAQEVLEQNPILKSATGQLRNMAALASPTDVQKAHILERTAEATVGPDVAKAIRPPAEKASDPLEWGWRYTEYLNQAGSQFIPEGAEQLAQKGTQFQRMLQRSLPDDLVRVTTSYAVPRENASTLLGHIRRIQKETGLTDDDALRKAVKEFGIKGTKPLDDLSEMQVAMDAMGRRGVMDSMAWKTARSIFGKPWLEKRASVAATERQIAGAGQEALRRVQGDIVGLVKKGSTPEAALEAVAKREWESAGEDPKGIWQAILDENYGSESGRARTIMQDLELTGRARDIDLTQYPTLDALRRLDNLDMVRSGAKGVGEPNFIRNYLNVVLEDGVRKRIVKEARAEHVKIFGSSRAPGLSTDTVPIEAKDGAFWLQAERKLMEGGADLARLMDSVPTAKRGELFDAFQNDLAQATTKTLRGAKYGYLLPNVPFLLGRALALPAISVAQVGLTRTLGGSWNALTSGGPIKVNGKIVYTPEQVENLISKYGVGSTAVEAERVGRLAQDLWEDVLRAAPLLDSSIPEALSKARIAVSPAVRGWTMRVAHAAELGFRRGVFVDALRSGLSPAQASELAKKSVFDYSQAPTWVRESIGKYLATAAQQYSAMQLLIDIGLEHPDKITPVLKALSAKGRVFDPQGEGTDERLKSIGITPPVGKVPSLVGPQNPIFAPVEDAIGIIHAGSSLLNLAGSTDKEDAAWKGVSGVGDLVAPEVTRAISDLATVSRSRYAPSEAEGPGRVDDKVKFWSALAIADAIDPAHTGVWTTVIDILDAKAVKAPANIADPDDPYAWLARPPEGTPFMYEGKDRNGRDVFRVYVPSKKGLANLRAASAITPQSAEQAFGAYGMMAVSPAIDLSDLSPTGEVGPVAAGLTYLGLTPQPTPSREERATQLISQSEQR